MRQDSGRKSRETQVALVPVQGLAWRSARRRTVRATVKAAPPAEALQPQLVGTQPGFFPHHGRTRWGS